MKIEHKAILITAILGPTIIISIIASFIYPIYLYIIMFIISTLGIFWCIHKLTLSVLEIKEKQKRYMEFKKQNEDFYNKLLKKLEKNK